MTEYDPAVLQRFADNLYFEAKWCAFKYGVIGLFLGAVVAGVVTAVLTPRAFSSGASGNIVLLTAVIFAAIGAVMGWQKAFTLRLEAQRTLCQLQIERNTRRAAGAPA